MPKVTGQSAAFLPIRGERPAPGADGLDGLPERAKEFAIVQSEWYLGAQGKEADLEKAMAADPAPDLVLFNGVANQYKDHPLQVATGEQVRVFVLNAGPSIDSSFHVVGTIFDTVIKEGATLTRGNAGSWGAQAVDLAPAQGAIIEFSTAEDGLYPMVTHAFNFVGRGALGLFQGRRRRPHELSEKPVHAGQIVVTFGPIRLVSIRRGCRA
jgi:nitrite reductase (NO-forming)